MLSFASKCKEMPTSQIFSYLPKNNYEFLYKAFNNKKTFSYIDKSEKVNYCCLCSNEDVMGILKAKKSVYVDKHNLGLVFKINLTEYGYSYDFVFDVFCQEDRSLLDRIIEEKEVMISFVVKQGTTLNKAFHFDFTIDESLKERIEYLKYITYNMQYPRIKNNIHGVEHGKFLEVKFDSELISNILVICDKLSKWKSVDDFNISLLYEDNIKIIITGECKNMMLIKDEIAKVNSIISEGRMENLGVPLLKYNKGYLYFYEHIKKAN